MLGLAIAVNCGLSWMNLLPAFTICHLGDNYIYTENCHLQWGCKSSALWSEVSFYGDEPAGPQTLFLTLKPKIYLPK